MSHKWVKNLLNVAVPLALVVVVLGAYTRLTHAGLGCPDWPGCYGHWFVPNEAAGQSALQAQFPNQPLEIAKAHTEMSHRYLAGTLGLIVLSLGLLSWFGKKTAKKPKKVIATSLMLIIALQAGLGRWTVTLGLNPLIVMSHLLMGFLTLTLLWIWWLKLQHPRLLKPLPKIRTPAIIALILISLQILLGGWTSANYAALVCTSFPECGGTTPFVWVPLKAFFSDLNLGSGLIVHELNSLIFIHMAHRVGALISTIGIVWLAIRLWRSQEKNTALCLVALLSLQVILGITNVLASLPLGIAVAHHLVAALLLLFISKLVLQSRVSQ